MKNLRMSSKDLLVEAAESALVVPVPEAEGAVAGWRLQLDPAALLGVPAHITIVYPFGPPEQLLPDVRQRIEAIVAAVPGFTYRLDALGWFGRKVVYLAPRPEGPFRQLIERLTDAFPDWPPYGGAHSKVIPHLTIGDGATPEQLQAAAGAVARSLPIEAVADRVWLMVGGRQPMSWHRGAEYRLATSPHVGAEALP